MAVLVEAISVIIRRDAVETKYPNGLSGFVNDCPNKTFCSDGDLVRIGFMTPQDTEIFCDRLVDLGFDDFEVGPGEDFVVVDQLCGPTTECDWIKVFDHHINDLKVKACELIGSNNSQWATPDGWEPATSLSCSFAWIPNDQLESSLIFLRQREDGTEEYLNRLTGDKLWLGRTNF
jgi:hypothetical protein